MRKLAAGLITAALLAGATGATAQGWQSPSFLGPIPDADLGVYFVDGAFGDFGLHGIWRQTESMNLGLRLGFVDSGDGALVAGVETWGPVVTANPDFPLDVSWTAGAGLWINGIDNLSVPVGLTIGRTLDAGDIAIQIYGHPRAVLVVFENVADDIEVNLEGQADLGADFYLSDRITLRAGVTLGDNDAFGIGLAWRQ